MTGFTGLLDTVRCYTLHLLLYTHYCPQSHLLCRCLVAAFDGRRSPSSGFSKCPRPQLPASDSDSSQQPNPSSLLTNCNKSKSSHSQSSVTADGRSASVLWCQAASWANDQIFVTVRELRFLFMWGGLSDDRTCLLLKLLVGFGSAVILRAAKISSTCHLYLQLYMSAFYIVVKSPVPCGHLLFIVLYVTLVYMYV
jgi:hypothetical protein